MMAVLLLYAYSEGMTSSRRIERRCREDLAFMYLTADACPDQDTVCAFRRAHLAAFQGPFLETLRIAQEAGVSTVGRIALDGTKIEANAWMPKAMSYARMPDRQAALAAEVRSFLAEAEALDRAEDRRFGRGRRGDELPAELQDPATRRQRLREAKARLEAKRGHAIYAQRKIKVQPVFGQIEGRGFHPFSLRGVDRVKGEIHLVCAVHKLVKLWRTASAAGRRWRAAREVAYA